MRGQIDDLRGASEQRPMPVLGGLLVPILGLGMLNAVMSLFDNLLA